MKLSKAQKSTLALIGSGSLCYIRGDGAAGVRLVVNDTGRLVPRKNKSIPILFRNRLLLVKELNLKPKNWYQVFIAEAVNG